MQAKQYVEYIRDSFSRAVTSDKKMLIITEIGYDEIATATSFVEYIYEKYGFSRSSVWYNLKNMKEDGLLEFAEKDDKGKPLSLTKNGVVLLRKVALRKMAAMSVST